MRLSAVGASGRQAAVPRSGRQNLTSCARLYLLFCTASLEKEETSHNRRFHKKVIGEEKEGSQIHVQVLPSSRSQPPSA